MAELRDDTGGSQKSRWPDSPGFFCTDGTVDLSPCPEPGSKGYGRDGNYQIQVPVYARGRDTVFDPVTGLTWQGASSNDGKSHTLAMRHCDQLQLENLAWRLPSRLELASLLDYGRDDHLPGLYLGAHWSSSLASQGTAAWSINFGNGTMTTDDLSVENFAICVSGEVLANRFETTEDTIVDRVTGLVWQRAVEPDLTWLEALDHCEALELASVTNWRLPSGKEFASLIQDDQLPAAGLENQDAGWYWTSSPDWIRERAVDYDWPSGVVGADWTDSHSHVRCVSGPTP